MHFLVWQCRSVDSARPGARSSAPALLVVPYSAFQRNRVSTRLKKLVPCQTEILVFPKTSFNQRFLKSLYELQWIDSERLSHLVQ